MAIDVGDVHQLRYDHYVNGALASAGTAAWTLTLPDGTTTTFPATPISAGQYRNDYSTMFPGPHRARWVGTGVNAGAWSDTFDVRPANPGSLISLADARRALRYDDAAFVGDDEDIRLNVEATTWAIEDHLRKVIVRRQTSEIALDCRGSRRVMLDNHPVISLVSVTRLDAAGTWTITDLRADRSGLITVKAGPWFVGDVEFVVVAGEVVVGPNIVVAARIIVKHLWEVNRAADRGASRFRTDDDLGRTDGSGFALPNRALELLGGRPPLVG